MHFTCQKLHSAVRASLAGILLARNRSKLSNASGRVEFYTPDTLFAYVNMIRYDPSLVDLTSNFFV